MADNDALASSASAGFGSPQPMSMSISTARSVSVARWTSSAVTPGAVLAEDQGAIVNVDDGEIGDDPLHHCSPGERQRALLEDLGAAIAVGVFHDDDDAPRTVYQIHGAAHAFDHLSRNGPVGEVSGS